MNNGWANTWIYVDIIIRSSSSGDIIIGDVSSNLILAIVIDPAYRIWFYHYDVEALGNDSVLIILNLWNTLYGYSNDTELLSK